MIAGRLPAGYTCFERWNSKPYCKDAGLEVYGVVEYPRALSIQERPCSGWGVQKSDYRSDYQNDYPNPAKRCHWLPNMKIER